MTRFCTNCGAPVDGSTKFCTNCGSPLPQEPQQPQQPPYTGYSEQQSSYQQQQSSYQQQQSSYQQQPPYQQPSGSFPGVGNMRPKPNNYLALSIIVTILCCWPLGIPAIVNAARVDKYWREGDDVSAADASNKAKRWSIISAVVGALAFILLFVVALADEEVF